MRGRASPYYGKLDFSTMQSAVKQLWYKRHIDPELCDPIDFYCPTQTDPDLVIRQDFARRLIAVTPLTEREEKVVFMCVLDNYTLREAGEEIGVSRERVSQILAGAMRKFRKYNVFLIGKSERFGHKYGGVMTRSGNK